MHVLLQNNVYVNWKRVIDCTTGKLHVLIDTHDIKFECTRSDCRRFGPPLYRSDWPRGVFAWEYANMVVKSRCFGFRALITQARLWERVWAENLDKFTLFRYPFPRRLKLGKSLETCCVNLFRLSWHFKREKPLFWKASFLQNKDWLRVQASCTIASNFNQWSKQESVALFLGESYFIKAVENFFPVFAYPDVNTRGAGSILTSYANPRRSRISCLYQAMQTRKTFSIA